MADSKDDIELVEQTALMDRAIWRKWNKFIWSGFVLIVLGLIIVGISFLLRLEPATISLLIGGGVVIVIVGIIRLLIGLINPLSPRDLRRDDSNEEQESIL